MLSDDPTSGADLELPNENLPSEICPIADEVNRVVREPECEGWPG